MSNRITHLKASHYFSVASQTLSYTKAAQQLNVSQAAVSQQIRLLEDYLGVPLFYRSGRDMRLTSQGQQLAEHLDQAFKHIGEGLNSVKLGTSRGYFAGVWSTELCFLVVNAKVMALFGSPSRNQCEAVFRR